MTTDSPPEKTAIVVLGMHRSGTSALSRALSFFDYFQPLDLMTPRPDNPRGLWESRGIVRLNDSIMSGLGSAWKNPDPFMLEGYDLQSSREILHESIIDQYLENAVEALRTSYPSFTRIVVKDPRICILWPLWGRALTTVGYRVRYILIHRNPLEVAASLRERDTIDRATAIRLWARYVLESLRLDGINGLDHVLSYEALLDQPEREFEAMGFSLDTLPSDTKQEIDDYLVAYDRHHVMSESDLENDPTIPTLVKYTSRLLRDWSSPDASSRAAEIEELLSALDDASLLSGSVVRVPASAFRPAVNEGHKSPTATAELEAELAGHGSGRPEARTVIIHYHLFKNAGTSVDEILKKNYGDKWIEAEFDGLKGEDNVAAVARFLVDHPDLIALSSHTALLPSPALEGLQVLPIIFLRHPIDRLRSAYEFERKQAAVTQGSRIAKAHDFAGYLRVRLDTPNDGFCRNFQTTRLAMAIANPAMSPLDRALQAIEELPFVGIVEAFDASMENFAGIAQTFLGGFKSFTVRKNVTSKTEISLQERLARIRAELGDALYDELEENNRDDLRSHKVVADRYGVSHQ